jgi:hypothetical protein
MISMKKKYLILFLIFGLSIVIYSLLCPQLCPSDLHGLDSVLGTTCSPFADFSTALSVLSSLPLMGLILLIMTTFSPEEFVLSPFRPPRIFS